MREMFAKIETTSDGNQALFYVEPDGDDHILHQIVNLDGVQVDIKMAFSKNSPEVNAENAYKALHLVSVKEADIIQKTIIDLMKEAEEQSCE